MYPREYFDTYWRPDLRDEVFVAMSFASSFTPIWEDILKPAIVAVGLKPHRVDTTKTSGSIITEIMDGIAHARVVLADISTELKTDLDGKQKAFRNANVQYELGLAHALRQEEEVLVVRRDSDSLSFDVSPIRVHRYDADSADESNKQIAGLLQGCLDGIKIVKSLKVQQAVESLDDESLSLLVSHKDHDWFSIGNEKTMGQLLTTMPKRLAVFKLLELGVIRTAANMKTGQYAYHWTAFGRAVLERLGLKAPGHAGGGNTG